MLLRPQRYFSRLNDLADFLAAVIVINQLKIGLYHQNRANVLGGAEYYVSVVAEALSRHHQVDLLHHKPGLTPEQLLTHYGTKLDAEQLRYIPFDNASVSLLDPLRRYRHERCLSEGYDLFIASIHDIPPFCHAPRGALIIHFPYFDRHKAWPWVNDGIGVRKSLRRMYASWEWRKRFEGYQVTMVNSDFTRRYTKQWWDMDSEVIYAPSQSDFDVVDKENIIISVGRFATDGNSKKQLELVAAFREMACAELDDWKYYTVGGLGDLATDHAYFEQVRVVASQCNTNVIANIELSNLKEIYAQAKIFWHGAGYGESDANPVLAEHFGIVTVEAMASGCIPIVIAKGGQPEIVEHEVSGFLWNTLEELKEYTTLVTRDKELQSRMSEAARARARTFSREAFVQRLMTALQPLMA